MTSRTTDALVFFKAWLAAPLQVASVTPSGRALSLLITQEISPETGTVIELGPGTGVFTEALLDRGVQEEDLVLIESGAAFAEELTLRFPAARTMLMDAARVREVEMGGTVGAVVSGLPLLSMPPRKVLAILDGAFAHLGQHGAFYQFTYGPRCPVPRPLLDRLGLKATLIGRTCANLPPAAVYRIRRRRPLQPYR
ncbi:class I SAM-dependent methyltransferase [Rhizobium sp. YIM 134829]|uniref:class I SAM-dependent methyltransferase n=1 Tax=Rhizobium sp. YIM 134829 TaxID=3390453 RepID=UPI00397C0DF9